VSTEGEAGGVENAHHGKLVSKERGMERTPVANVDVGMIVPELTADVDGNAKRRERKGSEQGPVHLVSGHVAQQAERVVDDQENVPARRFGHPR
jgi:hypothetical protein